MKSMMRFPNVPSNKTMLHVNSKEFFKLYECHMINGKVFLHEPKEYSSSLVKSKT